jgi:Protein of unknown function (DUF2490)
MESLLPQKKRRKGLKPFVRRVIDSQNILQMILFFLQHLLKIRPATKLYPVFCLMISWGAVDQVFPAENIIYERFDFRLKWEVRENWYLKNSYQVRFRNEMRNYHSFKMEIGAGLKLTSRLDIPVGLRLEDRHSATEERFKKSILVDPTLLIYSSARWQFDLRGRFQFQLSDNIDWLYFRPRPRLIYNFDVSGRQSSLFFYYDFFVQLKQENRDRHLRQNMFAGGLRCNLNERSSFDVYYIVLSSKSDRKLVWQHFHQPGLAYNFTY